jgi:ABC-type branched-subunit amino acid transport system substrate-binding protein
MKTLITSAGILSLPLLVCCASPTKSANSVSAAPIKVGAVLPFSGGAELYGRQAKLGLDLAVKEINARGGVLGRPVELMTHYNAMIAMKAALEKAGKVDKEAMIDALEGLTIESPAGALTIGKNHHVMMNMFLAKTRGPDLVTVRALGEIAPNPGCK